MKNPILLYCCYFSTPSQGGLSVRDARQIFRRQIWGLLSWVRSGLLMLLMSIMINQWFLPVFILWWEAGKLAPLQLFLPSEPSDSSWRDCSFWFSEVRKERPFRLSLTVVVLQVGGPGEDHQEDWGRSPGRPCSSWEERQEGWEGRSWGSDGGRHLAWRLQNR